MPYVLTARTVVPIDVTRVFAFVADAANLARLTPPWLRVRVEIELPATLTPGRLIDYRLRPCGVPMRWRSEITEWDPPHRFVGEQRRGPFRWWIHTHTFLPHEAGTEVEDVVDYDPRGSWLVHAAFFGPALRRTFKYRAVALREAFAVSEELRTEVAIERR
jgi:ligand-binding SRPBCC domain-containing protein